MVYVEGVIVDIHWGNPHIYLDVEVTGGDVRGPEHWRLESHTVAGMSAYGFAPEEFQPGDSVAVLGWVSTRGASQILLRAIRVNDAPMRSSERFADMIDISNGVFAESSIVPPPNLHGSPPERAGPTVVTRLHEMGLLDERGFLIWPPPDEPE